MRSFCRTQLKRNILLIAALVLVVAVFAVAAVWILGRPVELMDENAIAGEPQALPDEAGYSHLDQVGFGSVRMCGNPAVDGKDVYIYLTNLPSNLHLMRAEIYTAKQVTNSAGEKRWEPNKFLGRTGFIEPGTYVEKVSLDKKLPRGQSMVIIKVSLRNAETGGSEGFLYLNTVISN